MSDFWPEELGSTTPEPPVSILREQARHLSSRTKGFLEGIVSTTREKKEGEEDLFHHVFFIVAPMLDNYSYRLLWVVHSINLYPVTIECQSTETRYVCPDLETFQMNLKRCFADGATQRVIGALLAQSSESVRSS